MTLVALLPLDSLQNVFTLCNGRLVPRNKKQEARSKTSVTLAALLPLGSLQYVFTLYNGRLVSKNKKQEARGKTTESVVSIVNFQLSIFIK